MTTWNDYKREHDIAEIDREVLDYIAEQDALIERLRAAVRAQEFLVYRDAIAILQPGDLGGEA